MKKLVIKHTIMAVTAIVGLQMATSCNSCSHKNDDMHDDDAPTATHDTVYIDTCMAVSDSLMYEKTTGNYIRVNRVATTPRPAAGNGSTAGGKATTPANTAKPLTQEELDDRVENSSSQAYKNGKPVNSGGTSGAGQGTGTGSTGNNSRVTTKADQERN